MSTEHILDQLIAKTKLSKKTTDKQQKIVETAIKMFAEKGFANTSTSEIAKASGVAEGTIFRHYGTKDNLLLSLILPFIKELIPTIADEMLKDINPLQYERFEDFFRALIKNRLQFLTVNRDLFQVVVKELIYREDFRNELAPFFSDIVNSKLLLVLDYYKKKGDLVDLPNQVIIRYLLTFMAGYFLSRFMFLPEGTIEDEEVEVEQIVQLVMNGFKQVH